MMAGYGAATGTPGPGMMTGSGGAPGPGMMGGSGQPPSQVGSCATPALPGKVVSVRLADMGMMRPQTGPVPLGAPMMMRADPATVPSGQISLIAVNMGWRPHELVVLPLAPGMAVGQRQAGPDGTVAESGALGKASGTCVAGAGPAGSLGIPAGSSSWTTLTLAPGRYELICNLPNHYGDGMRQELDVTVN